MSFTFVSLEFHKQEYLMHIRPEETRKDNHGSDYQVLMDDTYFNPNQGGFQCPYHHVKP